MAELPITTGDEVALSRKSVRLERDTFIFDSLNSGALIAGLNQRVTNASLDQVDRWLKILFPSMKDYLYDLKEVKLEAWGLFVYQKIPTGNEMSWDNKDAKVPRGYHALFLKDFSYYYNARHFNDICSKNSYGDLTRTTNSTSIAEYPNNRFKKDQDDNMLGDELRRSVRLRDNNQCCLTGYAGEDVEILWIVPPAFMEYSDYPKDYQGAKKIKIPANCITLRKALVEPFMNNSFAIDVGDDYRIVFFEKIGDEAMSLLERQNFRATILKESIARGGNGAIEECFLKGHFRHTLSAKFKGGDAIDDFQGDSTREVDEMGRLAPEDHPFWNSVGGRALRAFYDRHWDWTPVSSDDDIDEEYREMLWNRLQLREQGRT